MLEEEEEEERRSWAEQRLCRSVSKLLRLFGERKNRHTCVYIGDVYHGRPPRKHVQEHRVLMLALIICCCYHGNTHNTIHISILCSRTRPGTLSVDAAPK